MESEECGLFLMCLKLGIYTTVNDLFSAQCAKERLLFSRDGTVVPVFRYREHFTEIPG